MASLKFRYATMGSGKSAEIISIKDNYDSQDINGMLLIPNVDTTSNGRIVSRNGSSVKAKKIYDTTDIFELVKKELKKGKEISYIIVDEANFLTELQVEQLSDIVDFLDIDVMAYGLLTNFKTRAFDSSKRLFEIADDRQELTARKVCHCGKKAVFNSRVVNGVMTSEGAEVLIDTNKDKKSKNNKHLEEKEVMYMPVCRRCFKLNKWKKDVKKDIK